MEFRNYINTKIRQINDFFSSSRGRDILLYLVFVAVSFVFWAILTLNNLVQENYKVRFNIIDVPKHVTIISNYPTEINVTVKNNGYAMLKYMIGEVPDVNVNFKDFADGKGYIKIPKQDLADLVASQFGVGASILSLSPESFVIKYTSLSGKKVPVEVVGDYLANFQYVVNGTVKTSPDSVTIYSDAIHLNSIERVFTEKIVYRNLTDSVYEHIALQKVDDVKIVPDSVNIMIPVEPLVTKHSSIPIKVENVPGNMKLITFPSVAGVSYLVPISLYDKKSNHPFEAIVDYADINRNSGKIPVRLGAMPAEYQNVQLQIDSVEYIIEH